MIIELHLLQSFPVSNLNRDQLGQPKTARFGGVTRARISSQALKRAVRDDFGLHGLHQNELGIRSKRFAEEAARFLVDRHGKTEDPAQALAATQLALLVLSIALDDKERLPTYLLFLTHGAAERLAALCDAHWPLLSRTLADHDKQNKEKNGREEKLTKSKVETLMKSSAPLKKLRAEVLDKFLKPAQAVDIALFGRMIADHPERNVTAASQVAHALSTHGVTTEFDYFTALDDLSRADETGASMLGTQEFNTACYYRYANLDLDQLRSNLRPFAVNGDRGPQADPALVARATYAWLAGFIEAVPRGKQASMASRTSPETFFAVIRERGAWNLANAFLRPVEDADDLMAVSTERLLHHYTKLTRFYDTHAAPTSILTTLADGVRIPEGAATQSPDTCSGFISAVLREVGLPDQPIPGSSGVDTGAGGGR
ncbi:CRISPR system Cascade subunit CasC [Thermocatellispora tengchongensis]|uniref:CRISPR system Cascade subunit CasC n=1 Tax=Thermocatellispora tengchongensis TaxID=1073253 RepID=A0A840PMH2_9ACTN|nr:type I-E CRISPR-associated protein Cas7/Cse4/CasC [Thermocatellispora tengchongensis]MBB5137245.1 CRISPR system Cascade subunit CasC [Thermocatellispora tengchongensis]